MDPIHPIAPGPPIFPQGGPDPVRRPEQVRREGRRDKQQPRRRAGQPAVADFEGEENPEDDGRPHIDVRA
jgi:hypothetical protein